LIAAELDAGGKVAISGFGTFELRQRKSRQGRNPRTGQVIDIPATRAPAFKPGKPLKEMLKG
jgi:nucleoid DNA-binding protein